MNDSECRKNAERLKREALIPERCHTRGRCFSVMSPQTPPRYVVRCSSEDCDRFDNAAILSVLLIARARQMSPRHDQAHTRQNTKSQQHGAASPRLKEEQAHVARIHRCRSERSREQRYVAKTETPSVVYVALVSQRQSSASQTPGILRYTKCATLTPRFASCARPFECAIRLSVTRDITFCEV